MGVVRYVAKRRFNHIDVLTWVATSSVMALTSNFWLAALTFAVGVVASVTAERVTGQDHG